MRSRLGQLRLHADGVNPGSPEAQGWTGATAVWCNGTAYHRIRTAVPSESARWPEDPGYPAAWSGAMIGLLISVASGTGLGAASLAAAPSGSEGVGTLLAVLFGLVPLTCLVAQRGLVAGCRWGLRRKGYPWVIAVVIALAILAILASGSGGLLQAAGIVAVLAMAIRGPLLGPLLARWQTIRVDPAESIPSLAPAPAGPRTPRWLADHDGDENPRSVHGTGYWGV